MTGLSGSESDVTVILRCLSVERKGFATCVAAGWSTEIELNLALIWNRAGSDG